MTALRKFQEAFLHDIYTGERNSAVYLDATGASHARIDILRNNSLYALTDVLANAYPVVKRVVGDDCFNNIARRYLETHPQPKGDRHSFGSDLAIFLEHLEVVGTLPYLPDIAALEWAHFQASLADDVPVLAFADLTAALPDDQDCKLALHPSVRIVAQRFDALAIWKEHQNEDVGIIALEEAAHALLIARTQDDVVFIRPISPALEAFLIACNSDETLAEALTIALETEPGRDEFQDDFSEVVSLGFFAARKAVIA